MSTHMDMDDILNFESRVIFRDSWSLLEWLLTDQDFELEVRVFLHNVKEPISGMLMVTYPEIVEWPCDMEPFDPRMMPRPGTRRWRRRECWDVLYPELPDMPEEVWTIFHEPIWLVDTDEDDIENPDRQVEIHPTKVAFLVVDEHNVDA